MSSKLFKLVSTELKFGLLGENSPYKEEIGNLTVYETYNPVEDDGSELGIYQVVIESLVDNHLQLNERNNEAVSLAEEIEMLWSYVWTTPLHRKTRGISLKFVTPPKGWNTNKEDIRRELDIENGGLTYSSISFTRNEAKYSNQLPLERALRVWSKYQHAEPIIKTLIDFHFESLSSRSTHSSLFLLSKGLEITRAYLPGKTDEEKQSSLPFEVQQGLSNTYHGLFYLANNRKNTRHAIKSKTRPAELHTELIGDDLENFIHDCDLIIRAVICNYFQEEVVMLKKKNESEITT